MIGESSSVTFTPGPALKPPASGSGSAWGIDKLGSDIDPEGVQARTTPRRRHAD